VNNLHRYLRFQPYQGYERCRSGHRINTHHVSFNINVVHIKWNYGITNYLAQSRSKVVLFDSFKLWEKRRMVMHIIPRFVGTIHGFDDGFVRSQSLIKEIMSTRQQGGPHGPRHEILLVRWRGNKIKIGGRVENNLILNLCC
jgi:hypothetical protein